MNHTWKDMEESVGKAEDLLLRIIQALNNSMLIFHLKHLQQKHPMSFIKSVLFAGDAAGHPCPSAAITRSEPGGTEDVTSEGGWGAVANCGTHWPEAAWLRLLPVAAMQQLG